MSMAPLARVGWFAALSGAVLAILGQALHPSIPDPASTQSLLETVSASPPRWLWAHLVGLIAMVVMTVALVTIALSLVPTSARMLALSGLYSAVISGAVFVVMLALDGLGLGSIVSAASSTASADRPTVLTVLGSTYGLKVLLMSLSLVSIGVTYVLHGTAIITSGRYWRPLGRVALVVGLFSVIIGCGQLVAGATSLVFDWLFPFGTYASAGWLIWMGIELQRGPGRAATPHAGRKM